MDEDYAKRPGDPRVPEPHDPMRGQVVRLQLLLEAAVLVVLAQGKG